MYQIKVDKEKFIDFDTKTVKVNKNGDNMEVVWDEEVIMTLEIPDELKKSFDLVPRKRGYFRKDENGDLYFSLIRYLDYHIHTEFSLLDGANKIKNIVKKSEGCTGVTDHGVMFGVLQFFKAMDAACKKPIIGIEVYAEDKDGNKDGMHMILLVKDETGWHNICQIISEAEVNFYRKPHVSYDVLEKYHEGLICTSACLGGEIARDIIDGRRDAAEEVAETLQGIFGEDFYLEIQDHNMGAEEDIVNTALWDMSIELGIKVVGATDAHYTNEDDEFAHEVLLAIGTAQKISDPKRMKFDGERYHLLTGDEFEELFSNDPELIENTLEIVDKCNFRFDLGRRLMPNFPIPEGFASEEEYFDYQCRQGWEYRFPEGDPRRNDPEYIERFEYEMKQIKKTGFHGYFLIVQDYVIWAKENGIYVGPGRGSCVGSLVCFCLRITDLDPIPYGLLFER